MHSLVKPKGFLVYKTLQMNLFHQQAECNQTMSRWVV